MSSVPGPAKKRQKTDTSFRSVKDEEEYFVKQSSGNLAILLSIILVAGYSDSGINHNHVRNIRSERLKSLKILNIHKFKMYSSLGTLSVLKQIVDIKLSVMERITAYRHWLLECRIHVSIACCLFCPCPNEQIVVTTPDIIIYKRI